MRLPTRFVVVLICTVAGSLSAAEGPSALLDKAIEAHGGAQALGQHKNKATYTKSRGTIEEAETIPFVEETFGQPPDKAKKVTELSIKGQPTVFMMVFNGERAWLRFGGEVREASPAEREGYGEGRTHGDALDFVKLKQRLSDLTPLSAIEVNGRPAAGLQVDTQGHRDVQLYFDKESGFLVKTRTWKKYATTGQTFAEEKVFSDYQDTQGYKWPKRVVAYRDGKRFLTKEVLEFKLVDRHDDSLFARP